MTTQRYVWEAAKDAGASGIQKTWSHTFLSKYNGRLCHQKWLRSCTCIMRWVDILIIATGLVVLFDNLYSKCLVSCTGKCPICFQYIQTPLWICFGTKDVMTHAYKTKTEMYWYKWAFITQCWWIVLCWNLIIHFYCIHQLDGDYSVQRIYNSVDGLKYFAACIWNSIVYASTLWIKSRSQQGSCLYSGQWVSGWSH